MPNDDSVEPAMPIEEMMKYNGRIKRTTIARKSYAECLDDDCPMAWTGSSAMGASMQHAIGSGHKVAQHYEATYTSEPTASAMSKVAVTLDPLDPATIAEKLRRQIGDSKVTTKKRTHG